MFLQRTYFHSIDEIFCDLTSYLNTYKLTPRELVTKIIHDVYETTGITATAGIGTNLFLCKVAMDVMAKHVDPDKYGVRIAELDEKSFREKLWNHRPITDFWRVGKGYAKRLEKYRMFTMGDVARCSVDNEELLYKLFGVNAELLIDHSWGWECATIKSIKECKPANRSLCSGQVLHCPYNYEQSRLIIKEMANEIVLDMVQKHFVTDMLVLTVEYDVENLKNAEFIKNYNGEIKEDRYGREVPKPAHGTFRLDKKTFSTRIISEGFVHLYDEIINRNLLIRKIYLTVGNLTDEKELKEYMEHLELIGEGGTDFRPAFEYVNHLIEQGEFYHLKGLIYFTDGKGTYPKKKPPYQTAFIFMQEEYEDVDVPPWAVKLIVDAEDLDEGEEEHEY